ncbi:lytic transglycosylase domain-containing protein [Treponema parvum]|uniref:Lytic transglycosylase domain-containing protein n=1 Tax=Treponema parvum TaxID=138851 RepID=A0A975IBQ0_9SPIR|nr:lytic transglycosylase domain-containing protein [Treponema parvum]QTQ11115.1 lytic transglycosylase domain-containing protein [Treponema parvum]
MKKKNAPFYPLLLFILWGACKSTAASMSAASPLAELPTAITPISTVTSPSAHNSTASRQNSPVKRFETAVYKKLDIEGAERKETQAFRDEYLTPFGQKKLFQILDDAEPYRLYVRSELKKRGMPSILEYLPVIESGYNPSARSKDGNGVGMWQFMLNSVEPFMTVNEWVDERLDPWKSTGAALTKLQDNYKVFKDWALAIGAYNCGAGAMSRALAKAQKKTFWFVAENSLIPEHTARYVPKLLAVADLAQNSKYYGINLPDANGKDNRPVNPRAGEFDYITVQKQIYLSALAAELRMSEDLLKNLNPALLHGVTPPKTSYVIRLPAGMKTAAEHAVNALSKAKP